jgi:hypothetical protein
VFEAQRSVAAAGLLSYRRLRISRSDVAEGFIMQRFTLEITLAAALAAFASLPAAAQGAFPNLVGTWKGDSESIVLSGGNTHHPGKSREPRMSNVPFTLVVDKQDGRRISGTFSSAKHKEAVIAVISRNGTIYMVDDDGYTLGTLLAPNRLELCYMKREASGRVASCTELTKQ